MARRRASRFSLIKRNGRGFVEGSPVDENDPLSHFQDVAEEINDTFDPGLATIREIDENAEVLVA